MENHFFATEATAEGLGAAEAEAEATTEALALLVTSTVALAGRTVAEGAASDAEDAEDAEGEPDAEGEGAASEPPFTTSQPREAQTVKNKIEERMNRSFGEETETPKRHSVT